MYWCRNRKTNQWNTVRNLNTDLWWIYKDFVWYRFGVLDGGERINYSASRDSVLIWGKMLDSLNSRWIKYLSVKNPLTDEGFLK